MNMNMVKFCFCLLLTSCASISLQDVEPEKLTVEVNYVLFANEASLDVFLTRGIWRQPVKTNADSFTAVTANGTTIPLKKSREPGRYGFRAYQDSTITSLTLDGYPTIEFPRLTTVSLSENDYFHDALYFKDDMIQLDLPATAANKRLLVFTGYCGSTPYQAVKTIDANRSSVEIDMAEITYLINQSARADLIGIIPITLALSEQYVVDWAQPFESLTLSSEDTVNFRIDTSGFRIKARASIKVSNHFSVLIQNQYWQSKFCY